MSSPLTIIVTGANAGLGLGICQRLVLQLADGKSDAHSDVPTPCSALTLIMACRSYERADTARKSIYQALDAHIELIRTLPTYDGHAEEFRKNLHIEIHTIDLSNMASIFSFAQEITEKYTHISHIICNAGAASWSHINWLLCLYQFFVDVVGWLSKPTYYVQHVGETTSDGLGWVWQTNLFGHFALFRLLAPLLTAEGHSFDSRVIWISSNTASPKHFDPTDLQILKSEDSYEAVKYQIDILATHLDRVSPRDPVTSRRIRHFVAHPSICSTSIANKMTGAFLDIIKHALFLVARFIGSSIHVTYPFLAAVSTVYVALASASALTPQNEERPVKYSARTNRWGTNVWASREEIEGWVENKGHAARIAETCDTLLEGFKNR